MEPPQKEKLKLMKASLWKLETLKYPNYADNSDILFLIRNNDAAKTTYVTPDVVQPLTNNLQ